MANLVSRRDFRLLRAAVSSRTGNGKPKLPCRIFASRMSYAFSTQPSVVSKWPITSCFYRILNWMEANKKNAPLLILFVTSSTVRTLLESRNQKSNSPIDLWHGSAAPSMWLWSRTQLVHCTDDWLIKWRKDQTERLYRSPFLPNISCEGVDVIEKEKEKLPVFARFGAPFSLQRMKWFETLQRAKATNCVKLNAKLKGVNVTVALQVFLSWAEIRLKATCFDQFLGKHSVSLSTK